ncbi:hypothetical protein V5R04_01555 [Jonesiaceae bacterium BS-20]|uniref:Uncharacterized protein n=1 Tax=Jonesiaceae bacterium BS-20 TaxID=3120821 RepID=A0AAU7DW44_9MICO
MSDNKEFISALFATRKAQDSAAEKLGRTRSNLETEIEKYLVTFDQALKSGWTKTQLTEAGFYDPVRLSPPKRAPRARTKPTPQPPLQDQPSEGVSSAAVHNPTDQQESHHES